MSIFLLKESYQDINLVELIDHCRTLTLGYEYFIETTKIVKKLA